MIRLHTFSCSIHVHTHNGFCAEVKITDTVELKEVTIEEKLRELQYKVANILFDSWLLKMNTKVESAPTVINHKENGDFIIAEYPISLYLYAH